MRENLTRCRHHLVSENAQGRKTTLRHGVYISHVSPARTGRGENEGFTRELKLINHELREKIVIEKGEKLMSGYFGRREGETSALAAGASKIMNHHTNGGKTMKMSKRIFKPAVGLFVLGVMLFSGSLWLSGQGATVPSPTSNAGALQASQKIKFPKISISLTFGRAKKNCGGWGICKITLGKLSAARTVQAELSRTEDGKLELRLVERAAEEGPTLFVDEDVPLSPEIAKQLGVKNATIQRGEYAFSASKSRLNARLAK